MKIVKVGDYLPTSIPGINADGIRVATLDKAIAITAPQAITDIRIYSLNGLQVKSERPGQRSYQIPAGDLSPGVYIVKVAAGAAQKNVKIIIR
jgi:hypothetical protein